MRADEMAERLSPTQVVVCELLEFHHALEELDRVRQKWPARAYLLEKFRAEQRNRKRPPPPRQQSTPGVIRNADLDRALQEAKK